MKLIRQSCRERHFPSKVHSKPERHQPHKIHNIILHYTSYTSLRPVYYIEYSRTMCIGLTPVIHVGSIKAKVERTAAVSRLSRRKPGGKNEPAASQRQGGERDTVVSIDAGGETVQCKRPPLHPQGSSFSMADQSTERWFQCQVVPEYGTKVGPWTSVGNSSSHFYDHSEHHDISGNCEG